MKKVLFFAPALSLLLSALGSVSATAADHKFKICDLQSHTGSNSAYMKPCNGWTSKNSCPGNGWLTWDISVGQGKSMYATALTALSTDKSVTVRLDGSSCNHYDKTSMVRMSHN
ncbi:hypothetical protein [Pleionea sp. CnH1-48]|uniref:hypothetical protein n=1 Tax=Pleionea sp. CnH1-48 TaxID=2954494 RepID=UPI002097CA4D|nr:hypothetical protein [Pleionea sp. CnH1-48]MCO7223394.1 hypothetical protein [Pleionea sp. CnH1-48]